MEVTQFDAERARLTAIATRILGSEADADDILQEAWLRTSRAEDIDDVPAWLTTVVTRLCLDQLRRRRTRSVAASQAARDESQRVVDAFLAAARGGDLATLLLLLAPDAVMRADLVGQKTGADPAYAGASAVAARFNGVRGAAPVTIDGERGAAWIHAGTVKVAFVFHVEAGRVREVELIADPDVLATMEIVRVREKSGPGDGSDQIVSE